MANDRQHNNLIKILFDGSKHLKHVLSDEEIRNMTMIEARFPLTKLPVCGHCEALGLWTKDAITLKPVGYCKKCGTYTKKPMTYSSYLASGYDIDKTGDSFRRMAIVDKECEEYKRRVYLPDFNRLEEMCK
jgi:hypothetical protein